MNQKPISQVKDSDLRLSMAALERAAIRARELAERTGTELIISRNGVIERVALGAGANQLREPNPPYKDKDDDF